MVDIQQIAIKVEVGIAAGLDGSVGWLTGGCARWKVEFCVYSERREGDARDALGGELLGIHDDDFLNVRVRGLVPVGSERSHCDGLG